MERNVSCGRMGGKYLIMWMRGSCCRNTVIIRKIEVLMDLETEEIVT